MLLQEALSMEGDEHPSGDGEPMGSLLIYPGCKVGRGGAKDLRG